MKDFDLVHSLRLILWDAFIAKKQAEAVENAKHQQPDQQPPLIIPEFEIQRAN